MGINQAVRAASLMQGGVNARKMHGTIVVGVHWSQFGHAMLCHRVADDEHADHHRPPNAVGGELFKKARSL